MLALAIALGASLGGAEAGVQSNPATHWAVELGQRWASTLSAPQVRSLRRSGIDTVVLGQGVGSQARLHVTALAHSLGLRVVIPRSIASASPAAARRALRGCDAADDPVVRTCALRAAWPRQAALLANRPGLDLVVLRLRSIAPVAGLALQPLRSPLLLLLPPAAPGVTTERWVGAIQAARRNPRLSLGIGPDGEQLLAAAKPFATALTAKSAVGADTVPPPAPAGLAVVSTTDTSVSLQWRASIDPAGGQVAYRVYLGASVVAGTSGLSFTVAGLACGTPVTIGVAAVDASGNASPATEARAQTAACTAASPKPAAPAPAPTPAPAPAPAPAPTPAPAPAPAPTPGPPPPSAPSGTANVYVSPAGNDTSCARGGTTKPCLSFNRAFQIAQSGDVVEVAGGSYGGQSIAQSNKTSAVTFRPAPGAQVLVASLSINASYLHVQDIGMSGTGNARGDLDVCSTECVPSLVDVVIRNVTARSAFIRASNVTVIGGEYGGFDACQSNAPEDGFRLWGGSAVMEPHNILVDHVTIHDVGSGSGNTCQGTVHAGYHVDCMQTQGGVNITIRGSTFYHCPTSNIQAAPFSGAVESNWTIENNFFGDTACCNSIVLTQGTADGDCSTFVVRYNVLTQPVNDVNCGGGRLQSYANVFTRNVSSCASHAAESYNVYPTSNTATCPGTGNKKCTPAFVNAGGAPPDYHLLSTDTCARAAGDPSRYPATDIDGAARPQGVPDAGADEIP